MKKLGKLFLAAKDNLCRQPSEWTSQYICEAIDELSYDDFSRKLKSKAKKIIHDRIYPQETVTGWLYHRSYIDFVSFNEPKMFNQIQIYRHRWLNELSKEFS